MSALLWIRNVRTPGKSILVRAVEMMGVAEFILSPSTPLRIDSAEGLNPLQTWRLRPSVIRACA